MKYELKNDAVSLLVDTKACEIHSFKRNDDDYEYMWNGNEEYWKGRNPILFPQVSSTKDKTIKIDDKTYPMGNHGFARNSEFTFVEQDDNSLTFVLSDDEDTLRQYPYHFDLFVNYVLDGYKLDISYKIVNKNEETMPFGFGLHPAFNTPKDFKDVKLVLDDRDTLEISNELFEKYPTYSYEPNPYTHASLFTNGHEIRLDFKGFDILAIWSPFAPFVCVEPWLTPDPEEGVDFKKRRGMIKLEPNEVYNISYSIALAK